MINHLKWSLLLMIGGCATLQTTAQGGMLVLKPQISDGRLTQATVSAYTQASIDHLVLRIYPVVEGVEQALLAEKTVQSFHLDDPILISRLKANARYRIKALAYATSDETELISTGDGASQVEVTLTDDDRPTLATLNVKLIDLPFAAQATASGVAITYAGLTTQNPVHAAPFSDQLLKVTTFAGNGAPSCVDGVGTGASFYYPFGIVFDKQGNLFVMDQGGRMIRKITPLGMVSVFAGRLSAGNAEGQGTNAAFSNAKELAVDSNGILYVADAENHRVCKITPEGMVSTFVSVGVDPTGMAIDASNSVYVADYSDNRIRKITPEGVVSVIAGTGVYGYQDGDATLAQFYSPCGLALDKEGNLFITENQGNRVRKLTPDGQVSTFAGSGDGGSQDGTGTTATLGSPRGMVFDNDGNLYMAQQGGSLIRKITPSGVVTTVAGSNSGAYRDGLGTLSSFSDPMWIAMDKAGNFYVTDYFNNRIRKMWWLNKN